MALDLSFANVGNAQEKEKPKKQESGLDLSFAAIGKQQEKQTQLLEQVAENTKPERSTLQKVKDFFTGDDRATDETKKPFYLPDRGFIDLPRMKVALGMTTSMDDQAAMEVIAKNYPKAVFDKDEKGNFIVDLRAEGGTRGALNQPGVDARDMTRFGAQAAAFFPSGKAAAGAASIPSAMARVGLASGATQAALETGNAALGGNRSGADVATDIGVAALAGGLFEGVAQALGKAWPRIKSAIAGGNIDDATRTAVIEQAVKLGFSPDDVTDDFIREFAKTADSISNPDRAAASALEKEFGVNLTGAQRDLNYDVLAEAESIKAGARGKSAQDIVLAREASQQEQLKRAAAKMQQGIAGDSNPITSRQEAGSSLGEGIRSASASAKGAIREAYANVGDAELSVDGFKGLIRATKEAVNSVEYPQTKEIVPAYNALKKSLSALEKELAQKEGVGTVDDIPIGRVDEVRKMFGRFMDGATNNADRRNITAMKDAFDKYLDDAVVNGLFKGDADSIARLKQARGLYADYMAKFSGGKGDAAGRFVEKIVKENPTSEEVINSLFTISGFNKAGAGKFAQRYKQILGADSEGWKAVRQAAFKNMIKTVDFNGQQVVSGTQTLKAVNEAWKQNSTLMAELFSPQELAQLRRFALLAKRTQPDFPKSRVNPSGSGIELQRAFGKVMSMLSGLGDMKTFFVMNATGKITANMRANAAAKATLRPFSAINEGVKSGVARSVATPAARDAVNTDARY